MRQNQIGKDSRGYLANIPQDWEDYEKQGKTEVVIDQRWLGRQDNHMQCSIRDWVLEEKKGINGKTGDTQIISQLFNE